MPGVSRASLISLVQVTTAGFDPADAVLEWLSLDESNLLPLAGVFHQREEAKLRHLVRTRHGRRRPIMRAAQVAGVTGVAAAVESGRSFQHYHTPAGARRRNRRSQAGIAAAEHPNADMFAQGGV